MKNFLYIFTILFFSCNNTSLKSNNLLIEKEVKTYEKEIKKLKEFAKTNGYNQKLAFMVDYSIHSGKNRFFIVDLETSTIPKKALVCHGSCKDENRNKKDLATTFSNTSESLCSTLGMSVMAGRAYSTWGSKYKYWIDGLEEGNKNMRSRVVVLHSWEGVPDEEIYPKALAMSWGCPTVSLDFLAELDEILKKEEKVLLYSFK